MLANLMLSRIFFEMMPGRLKTSVVYYDNFKEAAKAAVPKIGGQVMKANCSLLLEKPTYKEASSPRNSNSQLSI